MYQKPVAARGGGGRSHGWSVRLPSVGATHPHYTHIARTKLIDDYHEFIYPAQTKLRATRSNPVLSIRSSRPQLYTRSSRVAYRLGIPHPRRRIFRSPPGRVGRMSGTRPPVHARVAQAASIGSVCLRCRSAPLFLPSYRCVYCLSPWITPTLLVQLRNTHQSFDSTGLAPCPPARFRPCCVASSFFS